MSQFTIMPPQSERHITACVGFVSLEDQPEKFVIIKNKRGWDIPGGHVAAGESPLESFERELMEETGCKLLSGASQIAILESTKQPTTGIAIYRGLCAAGPFAPTAEIEDRKFMSSDELLKVYFGNKKLLQELLQLAPREQAP